MSMLVRLMDLLRRMVSWAPELAQHHHSDPVGFFDDAQAVGDEEAEGEGGGHVSGHLEHLQSDDLLLCKRINNNFAQTSHLHITTKHCLNISLIRLIPDY